MNNSKDNDKEKEELSLRKLSAEVEEIEILVDVAKEKIEMA